MPVSYPAMAAQNLITGSFAPNAIKSPLTCPSAIDTVNQTKTRPSSSRVIHSSPSFHFKVCFLLTGLLYCITMREVFFMGGMRITSYPP